MLKTSSQDGGRIDPSAATGWLYMLGRRTPLCLWRRPMRLAVSQTAAARRRLMLSWCRKLGSELAKACEYRRRGSRVEFERTESRSDPPDVDL